MPRIKYRSTNNTQPSSPSCLGQRNGKSYRFLQQRFSGTAAPGWWQHGASGCQMWSGDIEGRLGSSVPPLTFTRSKSKDTPFVVKEPPPLSLPLALDLIPEDMDFSKFRDTGELSDIVIVVAGKEFNLHKFPLFIKSDFFRALARSTRKETDPVVLEQFPGGVETFTLVANYCYNVKIDITKTNVCSLRCAAEFLQMNNAGNLAPLTDRYLQDILTSAKLGHKVNAIIDLVLQCIDLGPIAEQAKIVEKCLLAIVDCWLIASKYGSKRFTTECKALMDNQAMKDLCKFPIDWYKQLFILARDKSAHPEVLGKLAQTYITNAAERTQGIKPEDTVVQNGCSSTGEAQNEECEEKPDPAKTASAREYSEEEVSRVNSKDDDKDDDDSDASDSESDSSSSSVSNDSTHDTREKPPSPEGNTKAEELVAETIQSQESQLAPEEKSPSDSDLDLGTIMDAILLEVPIDSIQVVEAFSRKWVAAMLLIAETIRCKSRDVLVKLLGRMLHRFKKEDLMDLTPEMLSEIVAEGCQSSQADPDDVCRVLDEYLSSQAEKKQLTVDMFKKLVDSVPKDSRVSHDTLFTVLESILKSGDGEMDETCKKELLDTVDFSRLSESTLQRAFDSGLVPVAHITRAALALCVKLRSDLDTAHKVMQTQEKLIERLSQEESSASTSWRSTYHSGSMSKTLPQKTRTATDTDNLYDTSFQRSRPLGGATPTLASDLELKMALESLDRSLDRSGRGNRSLTGTGPIPESNPDFYTREADDVNRHVSPKPYLSTHSLSKWYQSYPHH